MGENAMSLVIIKGILLRGRYSRPSDDYRDDLPPGPTDHDIQGLLSLNGTYGKVEAYLKKHGRVEVPEKFNPLPLVQEGIISAPAAASCYSFNDCLVLNSTLPYGIFNGGVAHLIEAASPERNSAGIERTLELLKWEAGLKWTPYWDKTEERRIDIPELLDVQRKGKKNNLVNHLPRLTERR